MKSFSNAFPFFSLALTLVSGQVYAQEEGTIDRSVDVVNAYQPTLRKADRVAVQPLMDDTIKLSDSFKYQLLNRVEVVTTKPDTLSAAGMSFPEYDSPYRALLQAGVGTLPSFFGQVTFNTGASDKYRLAFNVGHRSMPAKVRLSDDTKVKAPQNETWADLNFHRFHNNIRFGFNFSFKNSAYRFYGLDNVVDSVSYLTETGSEAYGYELSVIEKQRLTSGDIDFFVGNAMVAPTEKFTFAAFAGVGLFGNKFGVHQTNVRFGGAFRFPTKGGASIDADLGVDIHKSSGGTSDSIYTYLDRRGVDIKVAPHFLLEYDYLKLRLGLRLFPVVGDDYTKDDFIVQPDLNADFFIGDGSLRLYAGLTGDYTANTYRHLVETNRYLSPDSRKCIWSKSQGRFVERTELRPSQSPILFKFGTRVSFGQIVQLHVGLDFRSLGDEVFFVNRPFMAKSDTTQFAYSNQFALVQDDGKLFRLHGELNVSPTENGNLCIGATYYKYKMDYVEEPWNRQNFDVKISGWIKPIERLQVKAALDVIGQRKAYNVTTKESETLDAYVDLNIGANYYISNRWTAFLDLNNICCSDQQKWLGYSSYRINAMVGITYKF